MWVEASRFLAIPLFLVLAFNGLIKKKQCFMAETHEEIRAFCPFNHFKKVKCWAKWQHWHMNWYTNPPLKDSCPSRKPPALEDFRLPCFITELHLIEFKTCF
jgi:hypothetical protein